MENLSITGEEDELEIQFDVSENTNEEPGYLLVGRFLTDRPIRFHIMKAKMAEFWRPVCGVAAREEGNNRFVFRFFHPRDMEKVLKKGPWSFNGHTLILGLLQQGSTPASVPLNHVPFWVQIHDLPAGCMSLTTGKQLGNFIGEFMEYDEKNNSNFFSTYMRIRVMIDVRNPLKRFKKIKTKVGSHEVKFKYERLGSICYFCGMLGHNEDSCNALYACDTDDGVRMWSAELRASVKNNGNGGSGSRWLREESSHARAWTAAGAAPITTTTQNLNNDGNINEALTTAAIVNNLGKTISLTEAFTNPPVLFPLKSIIAGKKTTDVSINNDELIESFGRLSQKKVKEH